MKVQIANDAVYVRWQYEDVPVQHNGKNIKNEAGEEILTRQTSCIASVGGEEIGRATVKRYYLDTEDKDEARRRSLERLLAELYPYPKTPAEGAILLEEQKAFETEKEEMRRIRSMFWESYNTRRDFVEVSQEDDMDLETGLEYLIMSYGPDEVRGKLEHILNAAPQPVEAQA